MYSTVKPQSSQAEPLRQESGVGAGVDGVVGAGVGSGDVVGVGAATHSYLASSSVTHSPIS